MDYEREWWGNCANTYSEETKQHLYAPRMGLTEIEGAGHAPTFDLGEASVMDIGSGPASLLLKCANGGALVVVEPCDYPPWVWSRYEQCGILVARMLGEDLIRQGFAGKFDEAWIYNVLQHVDDPELVVRNAMNVARKLRLFEWTGIPAYDGHPHEILATDLRLWIGAPLTVEEIDESGAVGTAFFGVFVSPR